MKTFYGNDPASRVRTFGAIRCFLWSALILLCICLPVKAAVGVNVTIDLTDATLNAAPFYTNRTLRIFPESAPTVSSPAVILGQPITGITDTNGQFVLSNAFPGLYLVTILAPPRQEQFAFLILTNSPAAVNASDNLVASSTATFPAGLVAWAAAVTDLRYGGTVPRPSPGDGWMLTTSNNVVQWTRNGGALTNVANGGTSLPAAPTNGWFLTYSNGPAWGLDGHLLTNLNVVTSNAFITNITSTTIVNSNLFTTNIFATNIYANTTISSNVTVQNFFSLTNSLDNLTVTNGVTNLALNASQFVVSDANKRLISTLNGNSLTNLNSTNLSGNLPASIDSQYVRSLAGNGTNNFFLTPTIKSPVMQGSGITMTNPIFWMVGGLYQLIYPNGLQAQVMDTAGDMFLNDINGNPIFNYQAGSQITESLVLANESGNKFAANHSNTRIFDQSNNIVVTIAQQGDGTKNVAFAGPIAVSGGLTNSVLTGNQFIIADSNGRLTSTLNGNALTNLNVSSSLAFLTNVTSTSITTSNLNAQFISSLTNVEDNLTVTNGITNLSLSASQFVGTDGNKRLVSTLNGTTLTNIPGTASDFAPGGNITFATNGHQTVISASGTLNANIYASNVISGGQLSSSVLPFVIVTNGESIPITVSNNWRVDVAHAFVASNATPSSIASFDAANQLTNATLDPQLVFSGNKLSILGQIVTNGETQPITVSNQWRVDAAHAFVASNAVASSILGLDAANQITNIVLDPSLTFSGNKLSFFGQVVTNGETLQITVSNNWIVDLTHFLTGNIAAATITNLSLSTGQFVFTDGNDRLISTLNGVTLTNLNAANLNGSLPAAIDAQYIRSSAGKGTNTSLVNLYSTFSTNLVDYISNLFVTNITFNLLSGLTGVVDNITVTNGITNLSVTASSVAGFDANKRLTNLVLGNSLGLSSGVLSVTNQGITSNQIALLTINTNNISQAFYNWLTNITQGIQNFGQLGSGTNTTATMDVGTGAILVPSGSGFILASAVQGTLTNLVNGTNVYGFVSNAVGAVYGTNVPNGGAVGTLMVTTLNGGTGTRLMKNTGDFVISDDFGGYLLSHVPFTNNAGFYGPNLWSNLVTVFNISSNSYTTNLYTTNITAQTINNITNLTQNQFVTNQFVTYQVVSNAFFTNVTILNGNGPWILSQQGFGTNLTTFGFLEVHDEFRVVGVGSPILELANGDTQVIEAGYDTTNHGGWWGSISPTNIDYVPGANVNFTTNGHQVTIAASTTFSGNYYASNAVSGGVFPTNTLSATAGANGWVLGQSNAAPVWTQNGAGLTNVTSLYVTGNGTVLTNGISWTNAVDRTATITNMCDGLHPDASVPMQRFTTNASFNIAGFANLKSGFDQVFSMCISNSAAGSITVGGPPNSGYVGTASTNSLVIPGGKSAYYSFDVFGMTDTNTVNALRQ